MEPLQSLELGVGVAILVSTHIQQCDPTLVRPRLYVSSTTCTSRKLGHGMERIRASKCERTWLSRFSYGTSDMHVVLGIGVAFGTRGTSLEDDVFCMRVPDFEAKVRKVYLSTFDVAILSMGRRCTPRSARACASLLNSPNPPSGQPALPGGPSHGAGVHTSGRLYQFVASVGRHPGGRPHHTPAQASHQSDQRAGRLPQRSATAAAFGVRPVRRRQQRVRNRELLRRPPFVSHSNTRRQSVCALPRTTPSACEG